MANHLNHLYHTERSHYIYLQDISKTELTVFALINKVELKVNI